MDCCSKHKVTAGHIMAIFYWYCLLILPPLTHNVLLITISSSSAINTIDQSRHLTQSTQSINQIHLAIY